MKKYNKKEPLIVIHLPKAGGTSVQRVFEEWFGRNVYRHYFNEAKNKMPPHVNLSFHKKAVVFGHFNEKRGFGVNSYYPEAKQFITFLRDPLELQISNYFYNIKKSEQGQFYRDGKKLESKNEVSTENLDRYLENLKSYIFQFFPWNVTDSNYKDIVDNYFVFIGITEEMNLSLKKLSSVLSKPEPETAVHENISERYGIEPSEESIQKFKENHSLEYKFYEYARSKLLEK